MTTTTTTRHLSLVPAPAPEPQPWDDRDSAIKAIRTALRRRSGKAWSVRGGRGTSWGWITITAPPARLDSHGCMTQADQAELTELLGRHIHDQGASVGASIAYRREYVQRAQGHTPDVIAQPYWD